jgi:Calcineurin-like phosphoesterase
LPVLPTLLLLGALDTTAAPPVTSESRPTGPWPVAAAVVPGLLLDGSGHFAAGDRRTAWRLLALDGLGLGTMAAGVTALVLTGASRRVVGLEVLTIGAGASLFVGSALADLYGVLALLVVPSWQVSGGARYVRNPVLDYRWLAGSGAAVRWQGYRLAPAVWSTADGRTVRGELEGSYRLLGPRPATARSAPAADGSFVEISAGLIHHREERGAVPFRITTGWTTAGGRLDLVRPAPSGNGMFAEGQAGVSIAGHSYGGEVGTTESNEAIVMRFGFGLYLGRGVAPRGELFLFYDHAHDDFTGGLKVPGAGQRPGRSFRARGRGLPVPGAGGCGPTSRLARRTCSVSRYSIVMEWSRRHEVRAMKPPRTAALALTLACAGCLDVADGRARRDQEIGSAAGEGISVRVDQGLAAVTAVGAAGISLWAQAPLLDLVIERAPPSAPMTITIDNVLPDAVLRFAGGADLPQEMDAPVVPTTKRWRLDAGAGPARLLLVAPDAGDRMPFRFALYGDVQERIDAVQDIYARMNRDPRIRFALFAGDLTTRGTADQLARFKREMKTLAFPVYATLGNHELGTRDDLFHDFFGRGSFSFAFREARFTLLERAVTSSSDRALSPGPTLASCQWPTTGTLSPSSPRIMPANPASGGENKDPAREGQTSPTGLGARRGPRALSTDQVSKSSAAGGSTSNVDWPSRRSSTCGGGQAAWNRGTSVGSPRH